MVKWQGDTTIKELLVKATAEVLGTALLLLFGCGGALGGLLPTPPSYFQASLNFGITVMIVIQIFGHISQAHVNPVITLGAVVLGLKPLQEALFYFVAQVIGAILGFGLLKLVTSNVNLKGSMDSPLNEFCVTDVNPSLSVLQGLLVEVIATAVLMLVACAVWDPRNALQTDSIPIRFGLAVGGLATTFGSHTACSMNPVRSLGPAFWNNYWNNHWVFWVGPTIGALIAALGYKAIFMPKDIDVDGREGIALNVRKP